VCVWIDVGPPPPPSISYTVQEHGPHITEDGGGGVNLLKVKMYKNCNYIKKQEI